ncbi:leucine-rich repeat protein [Anaerocolumna chitinilytica]|uniref:SbsA Ig-like domain-containing protein n=1 Tax=Anaerocolumna chitinilytica TaxID=1727145 RepID=A0A7I8DUJ9_9FIRM|nr:leucine-rich repeat protein [Anaerocolumna chitinilytica]BCK00776.1 hypothetical protein bsdcttw_38160 [Anaerocolumna chitinilytica]
MKKRFFAICLIVTMLIGLMPGNLVTANAQAIGNPDITVSVNKKIDVALAVGNTGVDYSNFSKDLKAKLLELGQIPEEDINVSELESKSVSTSSNSFNWWVYDHTINAADIRDNDHVYIEQTESNNSSSGHPYYNNVSHIQPTNNGADLFFTGYGASAYKDFMYLQNTDPTTKTFQFDIIENEAYDALDGVGFLFNTSVTGNYPDTQKMSGYLLFLQYNPSGTGQEIALYQFKDINTKNFHHRSQPSLINGTGFTKLASSNAYSTNVKYRKIKIETQPANVKVWYTGSASAITNDLDDSNIITWTKAGSSESLGTKVSFEKASAYGFGPLASYRAHGCNRPTSIALKNLTMSTEKAKTLKEVVSEPEWGKDTSKYIVNLNEDVISDLNDPQEENEIINRLNNDDVTYIGWGSDDNKTQTEEFIGLNNSKGGFVNVDSSDTDTYDKQITAIAHKILEDNYPKAVDSKDGIAYVLTSESVNLAVNGAASSGTADAEWPNGKWKVVHTTDGFSNTEGIYAKSGQTVPDLDNDFSLPGKYEIYYKDTLVQTVIAHRQPVAYFTATVVSGSAITAGSGEDSTVTGPAITDISEGDSVVTGPAITVTGAAITYTDLSYDPDGIGIDASKNVWKYIDLSADSPAWVTSDTPITIIIPDHRYLISLTVTDTFGAVSNPYARQVSYSYTYDTGTETGVKLKPHADFDLSETTLIKGQNEQLVLTDKSYDVYGAEVTGTYTVTKDGAPYNKVITAQTVSGSAITSQVIDFSEDVPGTYKISLTVTSENGTSEAFSRTVDFISDDKAPVATSSAGNNSTIGDNKVVLTFKDAGGSGLKVQKICVATGSAISEDSVWSEPSSKGTRTVLLPSTGSYYIHYEAEDKAGNKSTGYFGPITYKDMTPPAVTCDVANNATIGNGKAVLTFTDNSGIKNQKVFISSNTATPGANANGWSDVSSASERVVTFPSNGIFYIHYVAEDKEGNIAVGYFGPINYTDSTKPEATASISNGTVTGDKNVVVSFTDAGGSGLKEYKVFLSKSMDTPSDSDKWIVGETPDVRVTFPEDGTYYIHYTVKDNAENEAVGYLGPFTFVGTIPYVSSIITPVNDATNVSVNTNISFQVSENVVKGDGYLTVYDSKTGKKFLDIHSSNNKVKINENVVTVELPKVLGYDSAYYVKLDTNFVKSETKNAMAEFGSKSTWAFTTAKKSGDVTADDVKILRCETYQKVSEETTYPQVVPDPDQEKTFDVYAEDGELYIIPILSKATDKITVTGSGCEAELLNPLKIKVTYDSSVSNPTVTVKFSDTNSYTFHIKKLDKVLKAEVKIDTTSVTASVGNSNLLNTVDISGDVLDSNIVSIKVMLLIREPQKQDEKDSLKAYVDGAFKDNVTTFFDASLIKAVSDGTITSNSSISNTQEPVAIMIDIPAAFQSGYNYQVVRYHDGVCENLPTTVISGGTKLLFETDRFSTYGVVYTTAPANGTAITDDTKDTDETKEIKVPEEMAVTAGTLTKVAIENLAKDASVVYHVCTPTYISADANGNIFAKKAGKAVLMATVTNQGKSEVYTIKVTIKPVAKPTKVGYIQYYDQLVQYKNINYRITKSASENANGTVAVANNQINDKLPAKVSIPASITLDGKKYDVVSIDESAFYSVQGIASVNIPYSVTDISSTAFTGCSNLVSFTVDKKNPNYSAKKMMLLDKSGTTLISYPSAKSKITVDSKIKVIGAYAFSVCRGLKEVIIPSNVKEIDGCAFAHSGLTKVTFTSSVVPVMPYPCVFEDISAQSTIYVPKKAVTSYKKAFNHFRMPAGVTVKAK